jgi:peroxiredoxin
MVTAPHGAAEERPFPEFSLPDLAGRVWRLRDLRGSERAVVFCFASW